MADRQKFPIGINVFVIRDDKLLLGKRKGFGEGQWGLPGGHLEDFENMIGVARRELKEETSLEAKSFRFLNLVNDNSDREEHYIQVGFLAEEVSGEAKLMEPNCCSEWQWFPLDDLPENVFFGHVKQIKLFIDKALFADEGRKM